MAVNLDEPFRVPNGTTLKNRIVKAAMEEDMADVLDRNQPSKSHLRLYQKRGEGGAALIISGHVMIDQYALACPGDVVLAEDASMNSLARWREWAQCTQEGGAQFWLQINHPGRQVNAGSGLPTYAPSPIPVDIGKFSGAYAATPIAMTEEQISQVIRQFTWTAQKAEELEFSGVEIHAAHGYLISQFLSPLSNRRTDRWGGSLANRARLLFEVVGAIRETVSSSFGVGVKINSSDFQRGGFEAKDLHWVVERLNTARLDLLELSGGNAESPAMTGAHVTGKHQTASSAARESYFIEAAQSLQSIAQMPILVTGGIRRKESLEAVLSTSTNTSAGMSTAMGLVPDLPYRWAQGDDVIVRLSDSWILPGVLKFAAGIAVAEWNLHRIGNDHMPWQGIWPALALLLSFVNEKRQMAQYRKWIHQPTKNN